MHLKRQKAPKNWPIKRKGTAFVVRPNFSIEKGIPVLIILRDFLKIAQNRKETKQAIHNKQILLNNKIVKDEKNNALLFDTISILPSKKFYRVELSDKGRFQMTEIKEEESHRKVSKILNKKTLKGKKTQLNLSDGRNIITDIKCRMNDSVLLNFRERKIEKCLPMKAKEKVFVFSGKHSGKRGVINKMIQEKKIAELQVNEKSINVLIKHLIVTE
ncbi:hypothetical protein COU58_01975 [Candidatus Pacearchaeota archaeon CG10_big_fil_rev_8_21_14_0_10_32_42]|nr:MAG: hypothetical protein COU58_01975 [Candidatus Pacearchaeota archaeon CG10_big_fil_rev_8_21_14_0_10_32_42]